MSARIRAPRAEDLERLQGIEDAADAALREALRPRRWLPAPPGAQRAQAPGFLLIAADDVDDRAVGFVHVLAVDGIWHLEQLSVLPERSGLGIGTALVQAALLRARLAGAQEISLRTFAEVPFNAPFYARLGFAVTEPATPFELELLAAEERTGLAAQGRRVQMSCRLV